MEGASYHHETKILKGSNVLEKLCEECLSLGDKVLIVFSEDAIKQSGLYARVVSLLNICGIDHITYECNGTNYSAEETKKAIQLAKKENVQLVLAIGDEELMYFTKIVAHDFHKDDVTVNNQKKHLPIINIASILNANKKEDFNFECASPYYKQIKPIALFVDYDF
nr:iron-containing alcohol dehydrogenase [uncultured Pedobacter sp.]